MGTYTSHRTSEIWISLDLVSAVEARGCKGKPRTRHFIAMLLSPWAILSVRGILSNM